MKILSVRLCNLNSLRGVVAIDFRDPVFSDGLFAITGPTGAGKSTLLDAMCLALFHRTPRQDSVNQSDNGLMSTGAGECWAEVEFECNGEGWRARWSQHRAHSKPGGALQAPRVELARVNGQIECTGVREKIDLIEAITNLDYTRFTRSILLAQNDFAAFLRADVNSRADLLERMTGTEIYGEISRSVYERERGSKGHLETLNGLVGVVTVLSDEDRLSKKAALNSASEDVDARDKAMEPLRKTLQWLEDVGITQRRAADARYALEAAKEEVDSSTDDRARLLVAEAAETMRNDLGNAERRTCEARKAADHRDELAHRLADATNGLRIATWGARRAAAALADATAGSAKTAKAELDDVDKKILGSPHGDQLGEWIAVLRHKSKQLGGARAAASSTAQDLRKAQKEIGQAKGDLAESEKSAAAHAEAEAAAQDALYQAQSDLLTALAGSTPEELAARRIELLGRAGDMERLRGLFADRDVLVRDVEKRHSVLREDRAEHEGKAVAASEASRRALGLEDCARDKESIERLLATIRSLDDHRAALREGERCLLCGSTEHPAIAEYEAIDISRAEAEAQDVRAKASEARAEVTRLDADVHGLNQRIIAIAGELKSRESELETMHTRWTVECTRLDVDPAGGDGLSALVDEARKSAKTAAENVEAIGLLLSARDKASTEIASLLTASTVIALERQKALDKVKSLTERIEDITRMLEAADGEVARQEVELRSAIGLEALPDDFHRWLDEQDKHWRQYRMLRERQEELRAQLPSLELAGAQAQAACNRWNGVWTEACWSVPDEIKVPPEDLAVAEVAHAAVRDTVKRIEVELKVATGTAKDLADDASNAEATLIAVVEASRFVDRDELRAALLETTDRESLRRTIAAIDTGYRDAEKTWNDRQGEHRDLLAQALTERSSEDIKSQLTQLKDGHREAAAKTGELSAQLAADDVARARRAEIGREFEQAREVHEEWNHLKSLIGSADGALFRKFAQGLTLDRLVQLANGHLRSLQKERYSLKRNSTSLELVVVDHYQADAERATSTLSGGETFLASLSLALGLSALVSHRTRIDSFFLDEGFGTLDSESLDVALEALDTLNSQGKLIGVISHVEAVKDRFPVQIRIRKHVTDGSGAVTMPERYGRA